MGSSARVHVLYLEQADDQRGGDGVRCAGVHLGEPGRGACLCSSCGGVADVWRGRLDNMQTTLRMCCAEGAIFRPFVAQFAFASPRHSLLYDIHRLGGWMRAQGAKRPTEALIVGSALRVHAGELSAEESGISVTSHSSASASGAEAMWAWTTAFVSEIRARAHADGGIALALSLDKKAPLLSPSPMAGVLGRAMGGAQPSIRDIIIAIGGPSGLTHGWGARLSVALATPHVSVSLRGGLQHSYGALVEVLLMHERAELVPALSDRLSVPPELLKRARAAEHELRRAWLVRLGLHDDEGAGPPPSQPTQPGGAERIEAALSRHAACIAALVPAAGADHARASAAHRYQASTADPDGTRAAAHHGPGVAPSAPAASRGKQAKRVAKRRRVAANAK
jgi:hypothetical protein